MRSRGQGIERIGPEEDSHVGTFAGHSHGGQIVLGGLPKHHQRVQFVPLLRGQRHRPLYLPYLHDVDQVKARIHNAISLFTPVSQHLVHAYYGQPANFSYYKVCSTGGAQAFALAELHPELLDGIIAGSPAPWYSHLMLSTLWNTLVTKSSSAYLPQAVLNWKLCAWPKQAVYVQGHVNDWASYTCEASS